MQRYLRCSLKKKTYVVCYLHSHLQKRKTIYPVYKSFQISTKILSVRQREGGILNATVFEPCYVKRGLTRSQQALVFTYLPYKSFENTVGNGEIACNEQFLFFPHCFLPFWRTFCHFHRIRIVVCKHFQFGTV